MEGLLLEIGAGDDHLGLVFSHVFQVPVGTKFATFFTILFKFDGVGIMEKAKSF